MEWILSLALLVPGVGPLPREVVPPLMDPAQVGGFAMRSVVAPRIVWQSELPAKSEADQQLRYWYGSSHPCRLDRMEAHFACYQAFLEDIGVRLPFWQSEADGLFERVQLKAETIHQSDQPESAKREQLVRLITPGMTAEQVSVLLGQQQQFILLSERIAYLAVGCTLEVVCDRVQRVRFEKDNEGRLTTVAPWSEDLNPIRRAIISCGGCIWYIGAAR